VTSSGGIDPRAENSIAAATGLPTAQVEVVRVRRWRLDLMEQRLSELQLVDPDDVPLLR
jgi:hypothetical protein